MLKIKFKFHLIRVILKAFYLFPIKNNVCFFSAYEGKQFSCNPKYIFLKMIEEYGDHFHYIWEYNYDIIPDELNINNVIVVKHNSIKYIYYLLTSKYIFTNSGITGKIPLRRRQININTWHGGGAYKRVGLSYNEQQSLSAKVALEFMYKQTTRFLSSSQVFTDIMSISLNYPKDKFLPIGMPRNDILFSLKNKEFEEKIKDKIGLGKNDHVVLYAPTYRGSIGTTDEYKNNLDYHMLAECLKKATGFDNWYVLYRGHYYYDSHIKNKNHFLNVSNYPDMQELLYISDVLITDYSSSIWDYSFTQRPCFLFVPDLEKYLAERGFYSDIKLWPGILCKNNDELGQSILNFDRDSYLSKLKAHHDKLANYETGHATEELLNIVFKKGDLR